MRFRMMIVAMVVAVLLPVAAKAQPGSIAFVNVNLVPMDEERVLRGQTVIVENGIIRAFGARLKPPAGAKIVDGKGKGWLLPGLADMHNHSDTRQDLSVQLALGITTMLNMGEARNSFVGRTRAAVERGEIPGPRVFAALAVDGSPQYGHLVVATAEEASATVRVARANGYDFIKLYNNLSPAAFSALAAEARAQRIPLVGHGVTQVGLAKQLEAGQLLVAHAEEFLYTVFPQPPEDKPNAAPALNEIPAAVALVKRHGAFVAADLVTYETIARQWGRPDVVEAFMRMPETQYLAPQYRVSWPMQGYAKRTGSLDERVVFLRRFVKALSDAGVPLVSGTDAPDIPGLHPGFALHANLRLLEQAGLTRYQALKTATQTPGELIARAKPGGTPFGTIAVGSRADLVLTATSPLDDLSTLAQPLGVMAKGRWFAADELAALLADVRRGYDRATLPD